jgi:hypothetical protein
MREQKQRHGGGHDSDSDEDSSVGVEILDPTAALNEAKKAIKRADIAIEKAKHKEEERKKSGCGCW